MGTVTGGWFDGERAVLEGTGNFHSGKRGTANSGKSVGEMVSLLEIGDYHVQW